MDKEELMKRLTAFVSAQPSQAAAARALGTSSQHLNDILRGRKSVTGPTILRYFGYRKVMKIEKDKPLTK